MEKLQCLYRNTHYKSRIIFAQWKWEWIQWCCLFLLFFSHWILSLGLARFGCLLYTTIVVISLRLAILHSFCLQDDNSIEFCMPSYYSYAINLFTAIYIGAWKYINWCALQALNFNRKLQLKYQNNLINCKSSWLFDILIQFNALHYLHEINKQQHFREQMRWNMFHISKILSLFISFTNIHTTCW